jgi:uncharacterized protein (TIGR02391 family)
MTEQFEDSQIEAIAHALGHTEEGLTKTEIQFLLGAAQIADVNPNDSKWKRLLNAFAQHQNTHRDRRNILAFIRKAMKPERWVHCHQRFEPLRPRVNQALLFAGLAVHEDGELVVADSVATISEAQRHANELRASLLRRDAHPDVLEFCRAELMADNFFHAVLEATKSVAAKLRTRTGLSGDGAPLVDGTLLGETPKLVINPFRTDSEKMEQRGFATLVKGVFGMFRNPVAHEARIHWAMSADDAADLMSTLSLIHRRLDRATAFAP